MIDIESPFFRLSSDIMFLLDSEGKIVAANATAEAKLQTKAHELIGRSILDFSTEVAHNRVRTRLEQRHLGEPLVFILDFRVGTNKVELSRATLLYDAASRLFALIATPFQTMSEDENIRWRLILESSAAGLWVWEMSTDVMYFSDRLETMLGYHPGDLPLHFETLRKITHPDDVPNNAFHIHRFLRRETNDFKFECRVRKKSGEYAWIQAMGSRTRDTAGREVAVGWHFDIDELKRTEERLMRSEERSQLLLQSIPDLLFVFDRDGNYLEIQTTRPEALVQPIDVMLRGNVRDFMPTGFATYWLERIRAVSDKGTPEVLEYDIVLKGEQRYYEARLFPRSDNTIVAIVRDISARKRAEFAAKTFEDRFSAFVRNCPATIFSFVLNKDNSAIYTYIAGRLLEMFERQPEDLLGTPVFTDIPPFILEEDRPSAVEALRVSSETMEPFNWIGRFVMPSGRVAWINTIGAPSRLPNGSLNFNGISFDVTHERELAQQVQEQQVMMSSSSRLTALGEMAGGIAHEINNPLTVAHAHASRLRDIAESGKPLEAGTIIKSAEKIESVCMRISRIIAGLRSIARDGDNDRFVLVPLRPIIDDALSLSTEKFRHRLIDLSVDRVPESLSIECRSVQISQVLVNLLLNAQHAVEVMPGQRWIKVSVIERPSTVEIRVSDSGIGIPPEIRDRVFDPFFTTKEVGKGTGLGLSVSASIAEAHGGALYLDENEPFTTFVLILQKRHVPTVRAPDHVQ